MKVNLKILAGLGTALAASLCCITPALALLSGMSGMATTFSWLEPARPYCIGLTVVLLGMAWYRKLKPAQQAACNCEPTGKTKFINSKPFLGIVTVLAGLLLAFPVYAHLLYPARSKPVPVAGATGITTTTFTLSGMTCAACGDPISRQLTQLPGTIDAVVSYENSQVTVTWDSTKTNRTTIVKTINATGYLVTDKKQP